jgi:epoxyqueuosine reductase
MRPAPPSVNIAARPDASQIKRLARESDFALCGIADARPTDHREHVLAWLAAGRHGAMRWLEENLPLRLDPRELLPGARSVICVADQIGVEDRSTPAPPHQGRVARYVQVDDYHKVLKKRLQRLADVLRQLHPDDTFRVCVDTAPLLEREYAARAGLGWIGKSTMLIHPSRGSHLLLGEIVTSLELDPDPPEPDHCGTCTRCIDACPTQCITPYQLDASRCISYLTIEHREPVISSLHGNIGNWLYGCDICQEVCPYNRSDRGQVSDSPPDGYGPPRPATMDPLEVLNWSEDDRRAAFLRSAMKRAKLNQMKRNALLVLGNARSLDPSAVERMRQIAVDPDEDPMVRQTAEQVLHRRSTGDVPD